jgi:hypothetical protein
MAINDPEGDTPEYVAACNAEHIAALAVIGAPCTTAPDAQEKAAYIMSCKFIRAVLASEGENGVMLAESLVGMS